MSTLDIIKSRRSIRNFQQKEIPKEITDKLKEALIWAPSAGNLQARKFYFIFKDELKKKLSEGALGQEFISECPLVIVACANLAKIEHYGDRGKEIYTICDVSASIENMMLTAFENGLGSCWVGAINEARIKMILNLPDQLRPIALIPVGSPDESPEAPERVSEKEAIEERL